MTSTLYHAKNPNNKGGCPETNIPMPSSSNKVRSYISTFIAVLGVLFSLTNFLAMIGVIRNGISQSIVLVLTCGGTGQLSAVIGETIIAIASLGFLALLPAVLLYIALGPLRLRAKWFYSCTLIASIYFLVMIPFATVFGIVLLVALRRRRGEFINDSTHPEIDPEYLSPDSEHRPPSAMGEQPHNLNPNTRLP